MLESSTNIIRYDGNGLTDEFDYPFMIFDEDDLKVYVDGSLVSNSDYTVDGVGDESGGTVTFDSPPGSGDENVIIERVVAYTQPTSFPEGSRFPVEVVEQSYDLLTMQTQQLAEGLTRCVQVDVKQSNDELDLSITSDANARSTKLIAFNATGTGLTLVDVSGLGSEIFAQEAENSATNAIQAASDASNSLNAMIALSETIEDQLNAALSGFSTGDIKLTLRPSPTTGWVFMDDGTIGSTNSTATTRANDDTEDLYTLLWNGFDDFYFPVEGGRGVDAATDFAADKPMQLGYVVGRALYAAGEGWSYVEGGDADVNTTLDTLTVFSNFDTFITGMPFLFELASGTITGLSNGTTYYIIRHNATAVKLASTLLNAQNGTAINLTAKSSPVWSLTHIFEERGAGEFWGEQQHAPKSTEVAPHAHSHSHNLPGIWKNTGGSNNPSGGGTSRDAGATTAVSAVVTGGGVRYPVAPPGFGVNVAIKL